MSRVVYAIPNRGMDHHSKLDTNSEPDMGFYQALFEELELAGNIKEVTGINVKNHFDDPAEVFIHSGYSKIQRTEQYSLVRLRVKENTEADLTGKTSYIGSQLHYDRISQDKISSVFHAKLPDAGEPRVVLPYEPITKFIYIVDGETAYGPFNYVKNKDEAITGSYSLEIPEISSITRNIGLATIYKFDYQLAIDMEMIITSGNYAIVPDPSLMVNMLKAETMNYLTPRAVSSILKAVFKQGTPKSMKAQLMAATAALEQTKQQQFSPAIKATIKEQLLSAKSDWSTELSSEIYEIIKSSPEGLNYINNAMGTDKEAFQSKWLKEIKSEQEILITEREEIKRAKGLEEEALQKIKREMASINLDAQQISLDDKNDKQIDEIADKQKIEIEKRIADSKIELDDILLRINDGKAIENAKETLIREESLADHFKGKNATLKSSNDEINSLLTSSEVKLQDKLREMIPFISAITQAPMPVKSLKYELPLIEVVNFDSEKAVVIRDAAKDLVLNLQAILYEQHGRSFSLESLASLMVARQQSFLTILTGPPGVGKTSFYRLLNTITGQGEYSLEIPVGKGWVSDREFVGFYNSLTNKFAPAPSGIYQQIKALEGLSENNIPLPTVLLDEANLSAIEQYWSPFLVMADTESDRILKLTDETIKLPEGLRFVATTNHDMTTEPLSSRLVDRAPIIPMDMLESDISVLRENASIPIYSSSAYEAMFGCQDTFIAELDGSMEDRLLELEECISAKNPEFGTRFIVSQRKKSNVRKFIKVLTPLLVLVTGTSEEDAGQIALDYGVLYYLLPLINGSGPQIKNRLNTLMALCEKSSLSHTKEKLQDIQDRAEFNLDSYSFFQY